MGVKQNHLSNFHRLSEQGSYYYFVTTLSYFFIQDRTRTAHCPLKYCLTHHPSSLHRNRLQKMVPIDSCLVYLLTAFLVNF